MPISRPRRGRFAAALCAVTAIGAGCAPKTAKAPPPPVQPAGRLVPAVVAGFERGPGGWRVTDAGEAGEATIAIGDASRGDRWLAVPVHLAAGRDVTLDAWGDVPAGNWMRFGNTLRADVRIVPGGADVTARPYLVTGEGDEIVGPEIAVGSAWQTVVWNAGQALSNVSRVGLRWRVSGPWSGRLGVDNVRVGAEGALSAAYSVAYGPFTSREIASETMKTLKSAGVDAFPIYEQGWYLNVGTFSTRAAADKEAVRLRKDGLKTVVLVR